MLWKKNVDESLKLSPQMFMCVSITKEDLKNQVDRMCTLIFSQPFTTVLILVHYAHKVVILVGWTWSPS